MQTAQPKLIPQPPMPSEEQRNWLAAGLAQPGGKLPLYDSKGARISASLIRECVKAGWASPWALNPINEENLICRLTEAGRAAVARDKDKEAVIRVDFSQWKRDTGELVAARH